MIKTKLDVKRRRFEVVLSPSAGAGGETPQSPLPPCRPVELEPGATVSYLSLAGHFCAAKISDRRDDGRVDIDVDTGSKEPLRLTRIKIVAGVPTKRGTCGVLEGAND